MGQTSRHYLGLGQDCRLAWSPVSDCYKPLSALRHDCANESLLDVWRYNFGDPRKCFNCHGSARHLEHNVFARAYHRELRSRGGRLHSKPGKGRKAIILSARIQPMPHLIERAIVSAGNERGVQESLGGSGEKDWLGRKFREVLLAPESVYAPELM